MWQQLKPRKGYQYAGHTNAKPIYNGNGVSNFSYLIWKNQRKRALSFLEALLPSINIKKIYRNKNPLGKWHEAYQLPTFFPMNRLNIAQGLTLIIALEDFVMDFLVTLAHTI